MHRLEYLKKVESNARTYAEHFHRVFVSGQGIRVRDAQGAEFIDCLANAGALPLGHNHPEVKHAVTEFIASDAIQQALDLATPVKYEFVNQLFSHLPASFRDNAKIQFCGPSGSDAVEAAIKLAKFYTKRSTVLAFHGAYHGMTAGALGAMGSLVPKTGVGITGATHFAPYPYRFRCPFGTDGTETDKLSLNYLRTILSDPEGGVVTPAAVIVEIVQGEGGCIPVSMEWLRGLRELTCEHDIPLIIDEVQTGLGRTGAMFAFEPAGIVPDILVLSKAIGGGYPLAVVVYDKRLDVWPSGMHAGTFRGNQIAMVAGFTTMRIIERDRLVENAERMGDQLMRGAEQIAKRFACLGDVRGRGLMVGIEVVAPPACTVRGAPDGVTAKRIKAKCFENGLIVETGGRSGAVLRFLPALNLNERDVAAILDRFEGAVEMAHQ